jgi:hypothetical protein
VDSVTEPSDPACHAHCFGRFLDGSHHYEGARLIIGKKMQINGQGVTQILPNLLNVAANLAAEARLRHHMPEFSLANHAILMPHAQSVSTAHEHILNPKP